MSIPPVVVVPLATVLAMLAAWWAVPPAAGAAGVRAAAPLRASAEGRGRPGEGPVAGRDVDGLVRQRALLSLLAGAAPVVLLGGVAGAVAGPLVTAVVWRALAGREPASVRRRRAEVVRALPDAVDLLAVTMAAGASPGVALSRVASALEPPISEELLAVERRLALGKDPVGVWREVAREPGLTSLGWSMVRATESGVSVADSMHRLGEDLRRTSRSEAEARARTVGVRAAAPLGLCLLPAFVLVAVVPLVGSVVTAFLAP